MSVQLDAEGEQMAGRTMQVVVSSVVPANPKLQVSQLLKQPTSTGYDQPARVKALSWLLTVRLCPWVRRRASLTSPTCHT